MFLLLLFLVLHQCAASPYMKIKYQVNAETKTWRLDDLQVEYDAQISNWKVEDASNSGALSLYSHECTDALYNYQRPTVVNITSNCKYRLLPPRPDCNANVSELYKISELQDWTTCHPQAYTEANPPGIRQKSLIGVPADGFLPRGRDRSTWPCQFAVFQVVHTIWDGITGRVFDGMAYLNTNNAKYLNGSMVLPCQTGRCGRGDRTPGGSGLMCSYDADYKVRIMSKTDFGEEYWVPPFKEKA